MAKAITTKPVAAKARMSKTAAAGGKAKAGAAPVKSRGKRSMVWLQGLACGLLVAFATPVALLLAGLLAPGLVALALDRSPGKPMARAVLLFGMAASVFPVQALWLDNMSNAKALMLLSQVNIIGGAWAAAAGGWLLSVLCPIVIRLVFDARGMARAATLRKLRAKQAEAWGLPNRD